MIKVTLLGAGNVGKHLYNAFSTSENITVVQWYNRSLNKIESYKNEVNITNDLTSLKPSDIYIIAVNDDEIAKLSKSLPFSDRLVAHTSGSLSIHDLDKKNSRAVFYPLQTFSEGAEIDLSEVPICIEVTDKNNISFLKNLAASIGCVSHKITTEQRKTLHLAAVFVNNFTNQLYRIAHEISDRKSVDFDLLKPLIKETANKVQEMSPYRAQTGPALRNDKKTIKRHLKELEDSKHKEIYELLTASIKSTHRVFNKRNKTE